jgi:hypothetical protein
MKEQNELYMFRRHLRVCKHFGQKGSRSGQDQCKCPFHVDGLYNLTRVRQSLKTRSHQLADKRLRDLIGILDAKREQQNRAASAAGPGARAISPAQRTITEAIDRFLATHGEIDQQGKFQGDSEYNTFRNTGAS